MGFIPIFLTLGAFIFLFVMVVHQNLKQKKLLLEAGLISISSLLNGMLGKDKTETKPLEVMTIKDSEELLQSIVEKEESSKIQPQIGTIHQKLNEVKRIRRDYNKLIKTKPYYFVALLMGHQII
jgi:hypothetical protein